MEAEPPASTEPAFTRNRGKIARLHGGTALSNSVADLGEVVELVSLGESMWLV
jgi:hypothetical protein